MAKKKSKIKEAVETVESWVGVGSKAKKKATKTSQPKAAKKTKKKVAKKKKKKSSEKFVKESREYDKYI
jgi:hypothetical protein